MAKEDPKALPPPNENARPKSYLEQFQGKEASKFTDPCADASKASMACLNKYDYDRDKCLDYFQAYRDCKKAWLEQRKADRRAGRPSG
ncbi:Mitochondrial copper homeostasis protein [Marasmius tenuissimus]|uniref:Mitochondrial copper homeostasis protein n=1 Tax=Marasmius tenuissimus TaxID=585030 RepID=A0ABR2ZWP8_9AGAR